MNEETTNDSPNEELIMKAIESSFKGGAPVQCDNCYQPIVIERDEKQQLKNSSCKCGKYNSSFRGL